MELWDQRIEPYAQNLEDLEAAALANLAFDAIEAAIPLLSLPFRDFFPPHHADLIQSTLELRHNHPADWHLDSEFSVNFLAKYDELPHVAVRSSAGPFFMALVRLFEATASSVSADDTMEILSSSYESVLMSHLTGRITLEDELNSNQCTETIDRQIEIIKARI